MEKLTDNPAIGSNWDDVRKQLYTPEEIAASNARVAKIYKRIERRRKKDEERSKLSR